jgi:hypothetical protein
MSIKVEVSGAVFHCTTDDDLKQVVNVLGLKEAVRGGYLVGHVQSLPPDLRDRMEMLIKRLRGTRQHEYLALMTAHPEGLTLKQITEQLGLDNVYGLNGLVSSFVKHTRKLAFDAEHVVERVKRAPDGVLTHKPTTTFLEVWEKVERE